MMSIDDATLIADAYLAEPPRKARMTNPFLPDVEGDKNLAAAAADVSQFLRELGGRLVSGAHVASTRRELYAAIAIHALVSRGGTLMDPDSVGRFAWDIADAVERQRAYTTAPKDDLREAPLDLVDNDHDGMG